MAYQITGHTRLGGLIGSPVAHSISPMMYNDSFRLLGLDFVYLCFDIGREKLPGMIDAFRAMNVYGFSITMPNKEAALPYLDELTLAAQMIGAVNTVKNEGGRLIGHNTDGLGYMRSVREAGCDVVGKEMTLLGAGGAASAIAVQAALDGVARLHLVNRRGRSWDNAVRLVDTINERTACKADLTDLADTAALRALLSRSVLLTNATSVGMAPHTEGSPVPDPGILPPELIVSDIIYNPRETQLLAQARARGCRTFNGMYMLLYQGEAAFRIWTGLDMPTEQIRRTWFDS